MSSSEKTRQSDAPDQVKTTGHVWDGNLCEYDNPLPRWWLWGFYASVIFAIVYWMLYPAWPVADTFTKGFSRVTFEVDGEERTTHWNSRALLVREMQTGEMAQRQQAFLQVISESSHEEILTSTEKLAFVNSFGRSMFGDYCAACHQTGGAGIIGAYPNLADDNWHWGGDMATIEQTITHGRMGYMPAFAESLDANQLDAVASYVLHLAGYAGDPERVSLGESIFQGYEGGCYACHRRDGTGLPSLGAPNLTNNIWTNIDVLGAPDDAARRELISGMVHDGVNRQMPAFNDRLTPAEIKVLAAYVHQFGGGQ